MARLSEHGQAVSDEERCRLAGCGHEARDHGYNDGRPTCWRCPSRGRHNAHAFVGRLGRQ